jgi:hypothetical protein
LGNFGSQQGQASAVGNAGWRDPGDNGALARLRHLLTPERAGECLEQNVSLGGEDMTVGLSGSPIFPDVLPSPAMIVAPKVVLILPR